MLLAEDLLLFRIGNASRPLSRAAVDEFVPALAGALLTELALEGSVAKQGKGLAPEAGAPPSDALLAEAHAALSKAGRDAEPEVAIGRILQEAPKLRERLVARLGQRSLVAVEERSFLKLVSYAHHRLLDERALDQLNGELRAALRPGSNPPPRVAVLALLVAASGGLKDLLPTGERREAAERARALRLDLPDLLRGLGPAAAGVAAAVLAAVDGTEAACGGARRVGGDSNGAEGDGDGGE